MTKTRVLDCQMLFVHSRGKTATPTRGEYEHCGEVNLGLRKTPRVSLLHSVGYSPLVGVTVFLVDRKGFLSQKNLCGYLCATRLQ